MDENAQTQEYLAKVFESMINSIKDIIGPRFKVSLIIRDPDTAIGEDYAIVTDDTAEGLLDLIRAHKKRYEANLN